jgi:hypothetical protein
MPSLFMPHSGEAHNINHWLMLHRDEGYLTVEPRLMGDVVTVIYERASTEKPPYNLPNSVSNVPHESALSRPTITRH